MQNANANIHIAIIVVSGLHVSKYLGIKTKDVDIKNIKNACLIVGLTHK